MRKSLVTWVRNAARELVWLSHAALAYAKQVDPQRYAEIEPGLKSVRHPEEQKIEYVRDFISLVIEKLEGFVTEQDYKELDEILGKGVSRPEPVNATEPLSNTVPHNLRKSK